MKSLEELHNSLPYRKTNDDTIGNLIVKMMEVYGLKEKFMEYRIKKFWKEEIGGHIDSLTKTIFLKNRKVFIQMNSAPLKQELSYAKDKLKARMNEKFNEDYVLEIILL